MSCDHFLATMNGLPPVRERPDPDPDLSGGGHTTEARIHLLPAYHLILCACLPNAGMHMLKLPYLPFRQTLPASALCAGALAGKLRSCGYGDWLVDGVVYLLTSQFFIMRKIMNRMQGSTPKFFITLRNIGVTLAAVSAAVFESHVVLPTIITDVAGYLAVAGTVMGAVSQSAVLNEEE